MPDDVIVEQFFRIYVQEAMMIKVKAGIMVISFLLLALLAVGCTKTTPNESPEVSNQVTLSPSPSMETSVNIGAEYDPNEVQLKYVSFTPVISRNQAISTAKGWLRSGFNIDADKYPIEATVALYSGPVRPPNTPPSGENVVDRQVWIVVIKGLPFGYSGPPATPNEPKFTTIGQADIAIDAKTGDILSGLTSGRKIY